ncbi:hypothetical protein QA089_004704 [Meyerozyma guilliermondii]
MLVEYEPNWSIPSSAIAAAKKLASASTTKNTINIGSETYPSKKYSLPSLPLHLPAGVLAHSVWEPGASNS